MLFKVFIYCYFNSYNRVNNKICYLVATSMARIAKCGWQHFWYNFSICSCFLAILFAFFIIQARLNANSYPEEEKEKLKKMRETKEKYTPNFECLVHTCGLCTSRNRGQIYFFHSREHEFFSKYFIVSHSVAVFLSCGKFSIHWNYKIAQHMWCF